MILPLAVLFSALPAAAGLGAQAKAETAFLAFLAAVVLTPIALMDSEGLRSAVLAILMVAVLWAVTVSAARGAAVVGLLAVGLCAELERAWRGTQDRIPPHWAVAAALAIQALARSDELLAPALTAERLLSLIALPVAGGLAISRLATIGGARRALATGAVVLAIGPGFGVEATLTLAGLAAVQIHEDGERKRLPWLAPLSTVVVAGFLSPRFAGLLAIGLTLAWGWESVRIRAACSAVLALLLVLPSPVRPIDTALADLAWMPLLFPLILHGVWRKPARTLLCLLLGLAGLRIAPNLSAFFVPLALLAFDAEPERAAARLQQAWIFILLAGSVVLAAYPWLRNGALVDWLGVLGLEPSWTSAGLVGVAFLLLLFGLAFCSRRGLHLEAAPAVAALLALSTVLDLPNGTTVWSGPATLDSSRRELRIETALARPVSFVVVDSYVSNGIHVAAGLPIALVEVEDRHGSVDELAVRMGFETGEWAARRADVRNLSDLVTPSHWFSWVEPEGRFLAQRYRAVLRLDPSRSIQELRLRLAPSLPEGVSLALFHVEVRP